MWQNCISFVSKKPNLPPRDEFCISKNIVRILDVLGSELCFWKCKIYLWVADLVFFTHKANQILSRLFQLFNHLFADFEYHTRVTDQTCAYLWKINCLLQICCHLNIMVAVFLSICLFEIIKVNWPPKCTIECPCVIYWYFKEWKSVILSP